MNVANGFWLPALKARGIRTVVNVDGIEWERAKWGTAAKQTFKAGARLTARYADELVFDSTEIAKHWKKDFDREGTYIPYGGERGYAKLDSPRFTPGSYALVVARFVPENTIDEFLTAAEMLDDIDVVIVGSSGFGGQFDERAQHLAATKSNVTWLGHLADDRALFSLWENCGAYFHGHSVGGTNPALVQAMACGAPTVARDTKYNREVLDTHAIFVPPEATAIASAIAGLVGDRKKQEQLRAGVQARSKDAYTWDDVCGRYAKLIENADRRAIRRPSERAITD
jgi:glycosyltransferase involved in cell wall biosynthesis